MTIAYMVAAHSRALGFGFPLPLVRIVSNRSTAPLTDARMSIMSHSLNLAPDALTTVITPRGPAGQSRRIRIAVAIDAVRRTSPWQRTSPSPDPFSPAHTRKSRNRWFQSLRRLDPIVQTGRLSRTIKLIHQ